MRKHLLSFFSALACIFLVPSTGLSQQLGDFDLSFGTNGYGMAPFASSGLFFAAIGSKDEIFVANRVYQGSISYMTIVKFKANGQWDTSFGTNGQAQLGPWQTGYELHAIEGSADGGLFLSGVTTADDYFLTKMLPDGSQDSTFATNGFAIFTPNSGPWTFPFRILERPDGKVLLGADSADGHLILQFNADGTRDTGFGQNGVVWFSDPSGSYQGADMALQNDGKVVVVGEFIPSSGHVNGGFAVRFNSDGSQDTNFGVYNYRIMANINDVKFRRVGVLDKGDILVGGLHTRGMTSSNPEEYNPIFCRITSAGLTDFTYGDSGVAVFKTYPQPYDTVIALIDQAIGSDGAAFSLWFQEPYFPIYTTRYPDHHFVGKFSPDGMGDATFGNQGNNTDGVALLSTRSTLVDSMAFPKMGVQSNGKVILAGRMGTGIIVVRLENTVVTSAPDPSSPSRLTGFPNPIHPGDLLNIPSSAAASSHRFALYNSQGQSVQEWNVRRGPTETFQLLMPDDLPPGVYFLQEQGTNGRTGMRVVVQ